MNPIRIERHYLVGPDRLDPEGSWEEVSVDEFLRRTEWAGVLKKGTALDAITNGGRVDTRYAIYRLKHLGRTVQVPPAVGGQVRRESRAPDKAAEEARPTSMGEAQFSLFDEGGPPMES